MNNFKTKSEILHVTMPKLNGNNQFAKKLVVGIDGGYSSVKSTASNIACCFPSYAKKVSDVEVVGNIRDTDIILTDHNTGNIWLVGEFAQDAMTGVDVAGLTDESLFTRYRYDSDIFRVIMSAGLGVSFLEEKTDGSRVCLQTGLPSAYVKSDAPKLKDILAGNYNFSLRVGNRTREFGFAINRDDIGVMEQPRGTMASLVYDKNGKKLAQTAAILSSNVLIDDVGFYTEDEFNLTNGANIAAQVSNKTYTDTAMKAVFEAALAEINEEYDTDFKVFEMQKFLTEGVPIFDRETLTLTRHSITEAVEKFNRQLCEKSVYRLLERHDNLSKTDYLVMTGGTGESRYEQTKEMLSGISGLTVIPGNISDPDIPCIYTNSRGYYISMLLKLQAAMKKAN